MKYLILSGPGLGDVIQNLPVARAIKETEPKATVDFIVCGTAATVALDNQLLALQNDVDQLHCYSAKTPFHDIALVVRLLRKRYDFGFVRIEVVRKSKPSLWIYYIMRLVRCKKIVGVGTDKADISVRLPENAHFLERNRRMLSSIGISGGDDVRSIDRSKLDMEWAYRLLPRRMKTVALSLGTNALGWKEHGERIVYDVKSWAIERWIQLSVKLADAGCNVVLIGGPQERHRLQEQRIEIPEQERILDMVGKTNIRQSLSLLAASTLAAGPEGGMMHCAAAVGTKTLTLYGGSDPAKLNPAGPESAMIRIHLPCSPCCQTREGAHCKDHRCLKEITVDMVYLRIMQMLEMNA